MVAPERTTSLTPPDPRGMAGEGDGPHDPPRVTLASARRSGSRWLATCALRMLKPEHTRRRLGWRLTCGSRRRADESLEGSIERGFGRIAESAREVSDVDMLDLEAGERAAHPRAGEVTHHGFADKVREAGGEG
jgi:hypothetical protein